MPNSDTVASTMIYLFYRLALAPQHAEKIRTELYTLPSIYDAKALKTLDHLNGAINETLRLHPSVPTGGYRESPPEGIVIAGRFVPGNTTIVSPRYTMGRRTSCRLSISLHQLQNEEERSNFPYSREVLRTRRRIYPRAMVL